MLNESCEAIVSPNLADYWDKTWAHCFQSNDDHFLFSVSTLARLKRGQVLRKIHKDCPERTQVAHNTIYGIGEEEEDPMPTYSFTSRILRFRSYSVHCGRGSHPFFSNAESRQVGGFDDIARQFIPRDRSRSRACRHPTSVFLYEDVESGSQSWVSVELAFWEFGRTRQDDCEVSLHLINFISDFPLKLELYLPYFHFSKPHLVVAQRNSLCGAKSNGTALDCTHKQCPVLSDARSSPLGVVLLSTNCYLFSLPSSYRESGTPIYYATDALHLSPLLPAFLVLFLNLTAILAPPNPQRRARQQKHRGHVRRKPQREE
ncbi:hypothetical protein CPC08DRAFT_507225 [Agrocybe pediades]|nr:hypothetical protein CPC08DRAFT_507225 [Agrocybe pediades]